MELDMLEQTRKESLEKKLKLQRNKLASVEKSVKPMPDMTGEEVTHKTFGPGTVTSCAHGRVVVDFHGTAKKFLYPQAFQQGFLLSANQTYMDLFRENEVLEAQLDTLFKEIGREETQLDELAVTAG